MQIAGSWVAVFAVYNIKLSECYYTRSRHLSITIRRCGCGILDPATVWSRRSKWLRLQAPHLSEAVSLN